MLRPEQVSPEHFLSDRMIDLDIEQHQQVQDSMSNLQRIQQWLRTSDFAGLVIPSSDEYLSEFTPPRNQRLNWATGFRGSVGLAYVLQDRAALFLDGRYLLLGQRDTAGSGIDVLPADESTRRNWLDNHVSAGARMAVDARLHSTADFESTRRLMSSLALETVEITSNPIDALWGEARPAASGVTVIDYPVEYAGLSAAQKCEDVRTYLGAAKLDAYLLTDAEDVSWLLNVRSNESLLNVTSNGWHVLPLNQSRAYVDANGGVFWFVERRHLEASLLERLGDAVQVLAPEVIESFLTERSRGKTVGVNLPRTSHRLASIIAGSGTLVNDAIVARKRWKKHPNEIKSARHGHYQDGQAVIRFLAWLTNAISMQRITELDAVRRITELRAQLPGYKGLSMPAMSASGPNSSIAHYVSTEASNRALNDHPIYWMDSGGQYFGCTTDNTVAFALGEPEGKHIRAHTLVLKGFIALATLRFPAGVLSSQLDSFARQYLWRHGMDYSHGTGHGVGSFMSVHEGPHFSKGFDTRFIAPIEAGMILTNEPAYYHSGDFGIRIESHMLVVESEHRGFLEFETLSWLPIDPRLVDPKLLTEEECHWLAKYHLGIAATYRDVFDAETAAWLQAIVDAYVHMERTRG